jgi:PilZ domain
VSERRSTQRYELKVAITFRRVPGAEENRILCGEICNISTGGMYFTTAESLGMNQALDFSLALSSATHGVNARIIGRARVVRVARNFKASSEEAGVAVVTEEYHFLGPHVGA